MNDFWEHRWQNNQTGWDLATVSPPLASYAEHIPIAQRKGLSVLIPGCGNGYEAIHLLKLGFSDITMLDIAPTAIERLESRLDRESPGWQTFLRLVNEDFFAHEGSYDLILEQTFFCALNPGLRSDYALKMKQLLAPGGRLAGVLFNREFEGGPPFGGSREEYERLFSPHLRVKKMEPCHNSAEPRAGTEVFVILEKAPDKI
ncbi:MAG: methyltransferase [Saprospiraceae bacterium]